MLKKKIYKNFVYSNVHQTAKNIEKISVSHILDNNISFKVLAKISTFLELITNQRAYFIRSKKSLALLKIRKGLPIGFKVTLRKKNLFFFLKKLIWQVLPSINYFYTNLNFNKFYNMNLNSLILTISSPLFFFELQSYYFFFKTFKNVRIVINFSSNLNNSEIYFLSRYYQIPFK